MTMWHEMVDTSAEWPLAEIRLRRQPGTPQGRQRLIEILDAAVAVVASEGHSNLTTAAVAAEAGVSVGMIYRFFDDRVDILDAIALRNQALLLRRVRWESLTTPAALFETIVSAYRSDAGLRAIGLGLPSPDLGSRTRALWLAATCIEDSETPDTSAAICDIVHATAAAAFVQDASGSATILDAGRALWQSADRVAATAT